MLFLLLKRLFTAAGNRKLSLEDCKRITSGLLNGMIDMEFPQKENNAQKKCQTVHFFRLASSITRYHCTYSLADIPYPEKNRAKNSFTSLLIRI